MSTGFNDEIFEVHHVSVGGDFSDAFVTGLVHEEEVSGIGICAEGVVSGFSANLRDDIVDLVAPTSEFAVIFEGESNVFTVSVIGGGGETINDPGEGLFVCEIGTLVDIAGKYSDGVCVEVNGFVDAFVDGLDSLFAFFGIGFGEIVGDAEYPADEPSLFESVLGDFTIGIPVGIEEIEEFDTRGTQIGGGVDERFDIELTGAHGGDIAVHGDSEVHHRFGLGGCCRRPTLRSVSEFCETFRVKSLPAVEAALRMGVAKIAIPRMAMAQRAPVSLRPPLRGANSVWRAGSSSMNAALAICQ